jgi:hypothetical protein
VATKGRVTSALPRDTTGVTQFAPSVMRSYGKAPARMPMIVTHATGNSRGRAQQCASPNLDGAHAR